MYERAGRERARGYASQNVHHEPSRPAPTPAERAGEAVIRAERAVEIAHHALDALAAATAANAPEGWSAARAGLDERLREADRALERAKLLAPDASADASTRLEASARALGDVGREASAQTVLPSGITPVAHEAEIHDLLAKPIEGSLAAEYEEKEAALRRRTLHRFSYP